MSDDRPLGPPPDADGTDARPRILVVDDEPAVRRFLKLILDRLDFEVETAASGAEAIQAAQKTSYDIVLTDLIMPRVDGLEVIRAVKECSPDTEVVIITGYPSSETIVAATRAGAVDYLPKSPDPAHLEVMLRKALEIRNLRRKARERDFYLRMAQMDGLTELFNHSAFGGFLDRELTRARRCTRPLSLLFLDVDDFKDFNTRRGHLHGDRVLRQVAQHLKAQCRGYDIVARYGGDEFAVLAPETDVDGGKVLAERFVRSTTENRKGSSHDTVRLSVGVACFPLHAEEPEELVRRADEAMYAAKRAGGGTVAIA
ncbi:MAG: diguanylate cyclase [Deltaproteobacteria bacterium]|nr:diguanylate cyclase [Deltaproteobacteria bacterium]